MLVFRRLGPEQALALGLMVSQRNMGLMVAATDGLLPGTTWLYFAMAQFPIYLSPQLLKPIVVRLTGQARPAPGPIQGRSRRRGRRNRTKPHRCRHLPQPKSCLVTRH